MRKLNKKQKIIILIALITIVVIIGLTVVANVIRTNIINSSYNSANSNSSSGNLLPEYIKEGLTLGGVTGTLIDLDTSDATATEWDIAYGKTAYVNGEKITGLFVPRSSLKVGDYVSYTPDIAENYVLASSLTGYEKDQTISQDTSLTWQILSINNDGTVDLLGSVIQQDLYLYGAIGYNNGVYFLNDICAKQYSNKNLGVTARSIKMEDIEKKLNQKGINVINSDSLNNVVRTYYNADSYPANYYPNLYAQENGSGINTTAVKTDGISKSDSYYNSPTEGAYSQALNGLTVTSTYYIINFAEDYFYDINFYNLIFKYELYYLASRIAIVDSDYNYAWFGMRSINESFSLGGPSLYNSMNYNYGDVRKIRPVVTLNANIKIYGGDGSEEHPYKLTT